jgi:ABC-type transport system involved in multi-copper enzyme maturation permease subunit
MLRVIRKDLILNRDALVTNAVIFMGFAAYLGWEPDTPVMVYIWLTSLMFTFLSITVIAREDKFRAAALTCSLPVTRRTIVQARYVLSFGLGAVGVVTAFSLGALLPFSQLPVDELLGARTVLLAVTVVVLALGVLLPFTVRFGVFGVFVFLIAAQVLGVIALVMGRLFGGRVPIRQAIGGVVAAIQTLQAQLGNGGFDVLLLVVLSLVLGASYLLSQRVFAHREL